MSARRLAAALLVLAASGCSSVDLARLEADSQDLAPPREELKQADAGRFSLALALDAGATPDAYDPAHPDHYGMAPGLDLLAGELEKALTGAFARVHRVSASRTGASALDAAFDAQDQLLLDAHVTRWEAVFVKKNGWWYPNAFFLAWYFYPIASWAIADQLYGVQATIDYRLVAVRSGRLLGAGQVVLDSRATRRTERGEEEPLGPVLALDGIDRGIDLAGTYGPGDLSREQWQQHVQSLVEPYARREAAKALARDVAARLRSWRDQKPEDREAVTAAVCAVVVGVSRFEELRRCEHAAEDAAAIGSWLRGTSDSTRLVKVLTDETATREAVLRALDDAARHAQPEDAVVFYYAGRGARTGDALSGLGLACHDADPKKSPAPGFVTLAEVQKILAQSPSRRPVVILDASFAGGERGTDDAAARALDLKALLAPLAQKQGAVLAAAAPPARALDLPVARHGLFTHALLDTLRAAGESRLTWDGLKAGTARIVTPLSQLVSNDDALEPVFCLPEPAGRVPR